jgi:two-component system chemotaxis response regulator CheB
VLFELPGEPAPRFRCRVGHAWSPESLTVEQAVQAEDALWVALRALEEKVALLRRLAEHAEAAGHPHSARRHRGRAEETQASALALRNFISADVVGSAGQRPD